MERNSFMYAMNKLCFRLIAAFHGNPGSVLSGACLRRLKNTNASSTGAHYYYWQTSSYSQVAFFFLHVSSIAKKKKISRVGVENKGRNMNKHWTNISQWGHQCCWMSKNPPLPATKRYQTFSLNIKYLLVCFKVINPSLYAWSLIMSASAWVKVTHLGKISYHNLYITVYFYLT